MVDWNAITPQRLASFGLDITKAADRTLLSSRLDSSTAKARGFGAPYAGYPMSTTVAQTLRPYPQFGSITNYWSPLGNSWYDSLQAKVTKRMSHGLQLTAAFTWQKELTLGAESGAINDVFNRSNQKHISAESLPFVLATGFSYEPQFASLVGNKWLKRIVGGWTVSSLLRYQSGFPILVPASNNSLSSQLFRSTYQNRVAGEPLYAVDINCHCFDPKTTFVLNPKAWTDAAPGTWGTSALYYNDYRAQRRPEESASLGRNFRIREGMNLSVRAEFNNVFNRTYMNDPTSTNAQATQSRNAAGMTVSGFGYINTGTTQSAPRFGQIIARFTF